MDKAELFNLKSRYKSFRVSALEKLVRDGNTKEQLQALISMEKIEEDEECRVLLQNALRAVKARSDEADLNKEPKFTPEEFIEIFKAASSEKRINLLLKIPKTLIEEISKYAPELLENETDQAVASTILWTFQFFWPKTALNIVSKRLLSESLSIRLNALEVLVKNAPKALERELPKLLVSPDPRIRNLAIRGLSEIDIEEAIEHLDLLLTGPEISHKIAALGNCFYFPFDLVKPLLFKFLASENDPELLDFAGSFFKMNPDVEVPYKLYEILETSEDEKSERIKEILSGAFQVIETSQILGAEVQSFKDQLQTWIQKRRARVFVQDVVDRLTTTDGEMSPEIDEVISKSLKQQVVQDGFRNVLEQNIPGKVKDAIERFLSSAIPRTEIPSEKPSETPWEDLSNERKIRRVASLSPKDLAMASPILENILGEDSFPPDLKATAFRAAVRLEIGKFKEEAKKSLDHSDANLVAAGLEYLGHYYPKHAHPFLEKFLESDNFRLKTWAFRILKKIDSPRAISTLKKWLLLPSHDQKTIAFSCMLYVEFPLIRKVLVSFLEQTQDIKNIEAPLDLFLTNPDPENLYPLFRLEKLGNPVFADKFRKTRLESLKFLIQMGREKPGQEEQLQRDFEARFKLEEAKNSYSPPPYSVRFIQKKGCEKSEKVQVKVQKVGATIFGYYLTPKLILLGQGILLICSLYLHLSSIIGNFWWGTNTKFFSLLAAMISGIITGVFLRSLGPGPLAAITFSLFVVPIGVSNIFWGSFQIKGGFHLSGFGPHFWDNFACLSSLGAALFWLFSGSTVKRIIRFLAIPLLYFSTGFIVGAIKGLPLEITIMGPSFLQSFPLEIQPAYLYLNYVSPFLLVLFGVLTFQALAEGNTQGCVYRASVGVLFFLVFFMGISTMNHNLIPNISHFLKARKPGVGYFKAEYDSSWDKRRVSKLIPDTNRHEVEIFTSSAKPLNTEQSKLKLDYLMKFEIFPAPFPNQKNTLRLKVKDKERFNDVLNLFPEDLRVEENGVEQSFSFKKNLEQHSLFQSNKVLICIEHYYPHGTKLAVQSLIQKLMPNFEVRIEHSNWDNMKETQRGFTNDVRVLNYALSNFEGFEMIVDGLTEAYKKLETLNNGEGIIVAFVGSRPIDWNNKLEDLKKRISGNRNIQLNILGFHSDREAGDKYRELASLGHGGYFHALTEEEYLKKAVDLFDKSSVIYEIEYLKKFDPDVHVKPILSSNTERIATISIPVLPQSDDKPKVQLNQEGR